MADRSDDDPLDVLLVAGRFEVRGSSTQTLDIARFLPRLGLPPERPADDPGLSAKRAAIKGAVPVRVRILCLDSSRLSVRRTEGLEIATVPVLGWRGFGRALRRYVLRDILRDPPDVIHVQGQTVHPIGRWIARKTRRPYVLTLHREPTRKDRLRLDRVYGRQVLATNEAVRRAVVDNTPIRADLVRVVRTGVDSPEDGPRAELLAKRHRPVIGTAGALEAGQGIEHFIAAAHRVLRELQDRSGVDHLTDEGRPDDPLPEFLIAGSGPDERALRDRARRLGVSERVTFVSNLFDFAESLSAMDLFCLPAERPGMGVTMLEAMSRGIPVIATDVGPVTHMLEHETTGLVIPSANASAISAAVLRLLDNPHEARRLGAAGKRLVEERFPLRNMLEDVLQVYREAVGQAPPAARASSD